MKKFEAIIQIDGKDWTEAHDRLVTKLNKAKVKGRLIYFHEVGKD